MQLKYLAAAAAASLLAAGAAQAQPNSVTPDMPNPVAAAQGSQSRATDHTSGDHATSSASTGATASAGASVSSSEGVTASTGTATTASDVGSTTMTTTTVTNGPVPDTAENRAKYGQPLSRAGKRTAARGN